MDLNARLYLLLLFLLSIIDFCRSMALFPSENEDHPNNIRKFKLYSRTGYYLTISEEGEAGITLNASDPDAVLEAESYAHNKRRIRRPQSYYLAIDKHGHIKTRKKPKKDTMFIETMREGGWLRYQNEQTEYMLSVRPKDVKFVRPFRKGKHLKRKSEFLMLLCETPACSL